MRILDILKQSKGAKPEKVLENDVHSHLLPAIDDGSQSLEESIALIEEFKKLGYKKAITTPHILQDYYPNTPEIILEKLDTVNAELVRLNIDFELEAAAEYYLDEFLIEKVKLGDPLLTFGNDYLLFEMAFMSVSPYLSDLVFEINTKGMHPILAHAERYSYYYNDLNAIHELISRGCHIQVNINSLVGIYGKPARKLAESLIDNSMVHMLGTDCHTLQHLHLIKKAQSSKYYQKALNLPLINYSL